MCELGGIDNVSQMGKNGFTMLNTNGKMEETKAEYVLLNYGYENTFYEVAHIPKSYILVRIT